MTCKDCGTCTNCGQSNVIARRDQGLRYLDSGFKKYWRPIAAYVYLAICIIDFVAMPAYIEIQNRHVNTEAFEEIRTLTDVQVKLKALDQLDLGNRSWSPLTLTSGGMFHLSFGAIIGISAFTRGQEKVAAIKS